MLVEDDIDVALGPGAYLEPCGIALDFAHTARAARAVPRKRRSIVVLDVQLPDGDGVALCRELKQRGLRPTLAYLGHELRTPLQSAQTSIALLQERKDDDGAFERLKRAVARLSRASQAALWLATERDPDLTAAHPALPVVRTLLDDLQPLATMVGKSISVDIPAEVTFRGPPEVAEAVLGNLLLNAIQHGAGPIRIEAIPLQNSLVITLRRVLKFAGIALGALVGVPMLAFATAVLWPHADALPVETKVPLAVTGVTVIDVRAGKHIADQAVVIQGNRITAVGKTGTMPLPPGTKVVDGRGRYLMPALWDMHTHVYAVSPLLDMPLYIAFGVTNVRDLQGCPTKGDPFIACYEDKQRWTKEAVAGTRVAPRIVEASSFMANGPGMAKRLGTVPTYFDVATPEQARRFVRHFVGRADSIKVYDNIPRDAYLALVDEAATVRLRVVGHKPKAVGAVEAAAHQRSIEHARFILHDSFDGSEALRAAAGSPSWKEDRRAMVDRHDPDKARQIFEAMRARGTYYVPTHLTRWSDAYADQPAVREDAALAYLHPLMKMQWLEDIDEIVARDPGAEARKAYIDFYEKGLVLTKEAHAAGVRIMVGTDYISAGQDVHRELQQLVKAGLTPQQALVAATITPAEYAGQSDYYGEVTTGRVADLILLGADPLVDIRNTQNLKAVIFNGALYDEAALEGLRQKVRDNARSWSVGAKILWRFIRTPANY